ncbi:hypothetical protein P171DRAFT_445323 [Karstenula rhodostoma CBS 690.94]|uniref:Uncharacterized protein n=1 Tax=Karstenula rhodostoma CBS 690.94 TaxID=1392251 RepID=A0A9P4U8V7_9PLEO|nr:hypothetical protein P171DRAFT_445323 [Karstenula rhodostoma CBS 690.94]
MPPALTTAPEVNCLESPEQAPLFPPRPILLRFLEESRRLEQASNRVDPSKIIMGTASPTTISIDEANIMQLQRGRACETLTTNYHDLSCGHLVTTSTGFPTPYDLKAPCASNCCRSQPTTHGTLTPFVCPVCLETLIRRNYVKTYKEFTAAGYYPDPDPAENVKKWLCCSIRLVSNFGPRIVQGMSGLFLLGDEEKFLHVNFMPSVVSDMYNRWSFESRQHQRSRSRSHQRDIRMDRVSSRVHKDRAVSRRTRLKRDRSSSERRTLSRLHQDRSPLRATMRVDLDGLAERLGDTRIGLLEDGEVDDLLQRVSKI